MTATCRLLFLGAGFSQPAGLPLGRELFREVRRANISLHGWDNHLEADLDRYIRYLAECEGREETADTIDYEEFLGFLDIEHYLGLRGKDTWSSDGNESQLMIRWGIARILFERLPRTPEDIPAAYLRFATQLTTSDWVLTFNYDTLLEQSLDRVGIPYRLFPYRYSELGWGLNTIDNSRDELVLLKLHGSIDWFDRTVYDEHLAHASAHPLPYVPKHPIFGPDRKVDASPIVDGPRSPEDPLAKVFRVSNLGALKDEPFWRCCPLILAPSSTKLFYSRPIHDFWWGLQQAGGLSLSLGIIGYSLPQYDNYARQAIYHMTRNYTGYEPDFTFQGRTKTKIRLVDLRYDPNSITAFKESYRFLDWERTELRFDGFNDSTADWILR